MVEPRKVNTDTARFRRCKSGSSCSSRKGCGESMEMASPVRSWQNLASSSTTPTLFEPGNSPANCLIFFLIQLSTAWGNFLIASFTPSSLGLNSLPPSFSINLLIISNSQMVYRGGWYDHIEGCVSSFLYWLYWSLMNDVQVWMSCFRALFSWMRWARWTGV